MSAKLLKNKTKWISGNKLTVNDFQLAHIMWTYWKNDKHSKAMVYTLKCQDILISKYPVMVQYFKCLEKELHTIIRDRKACPW